MDLFNLLFSGWLPVTLVQERKERRHTKSTGWELSPGSAPGLHSKERLDQVGAWVPYLPPWHLSGRERQDCLFMLCMELPLAPTGEVERRAHV